MITVPYDHKMAAHCESGTVTAMLNHHGLAISEAMVFGISGALFFAYLDTPKLPFPMFVLRNQPGKIRTNLAKRLGVKFETRRFSDPAESFRALDALLESGIPVGVQVDYFYMNYLPEYSRVHFNAHYITVIGKDGDEYLVSDIYSPRVARLDRATLERARFAKGPFAPRGVLFHPVGVPASPDLAPAIRRGIKSSAFYMLKIPLVPFLGVKGIRYFARKLLTWPERARDAEHLSHEIMMIAVAIEDRGTGGGAFRYLYATFLQEAAKILDNPKLAEFSAAMMENGDAWRQIALHAARLAKGRSLGPDPLRELSRRILERADVEQDFFRRLVRAL